MTAEEKTFVTIGNGFSESKQSQMFGKPCFKIHGKAYICFFQNEMVFKLKGEVHEVALSLKGSCLFDPSGKKRPMKEWVQIPSSHLSYWPKFATEALQYVLASIPNEIK